MKQFTATVIDPVGLHARPATLTVNAASKFISDIKILANGKEGNLKSIINIMAMGVKKGDELTIQANGEDEDIAIETIMQEMKKNNIIG